MIAGFPSMAAWEPDLESFRRLFCLSEELTPKNII